ncbi:MAG: MFS transporter, partial [Kiritimatiellae bacterium]|nr:MFS transporter [Kiritimatiellia bacterium]
MLLRVVQGALTGTLAANTVLVAGVAPPESTGAAIGLLYSMSHAGMIVGPLVGGIVADSLGFRAVFWTAAALALGAALLIGFFTEQPAPGPRKGREKRPLSFRALFAIGGFSVVALALFQMALATNSAKPLFPLFIAEMHGGSEGASTLTGLVMGATAGAAVACTGLLGRLSDRWGYRNMLALATFLSSVLLCLHAAATAVAHLFVLRVLLGFCMAAIQPSAAALVRSLVPARSIGTALGLMQSVRAAGHALGPVFGGYLAGHI